MQGHSRYRFGAEGKPAHIVARRLAVPLAQRQIDRVDQGGARRSHHPGRIRHVMAQAKRQCLSQPRPGPPRCFRGVINHHRQQHHAVELLGQPFGDRGKLHLLGVEGVGVFEQGVASLDGASAISAQSVTDGDALLQAWRRRTTIAGLFHGQLQRQRVQHLIGFLHHRVHLGRGTTDDFRVSRNSGGHQFAHSHVLAPPAVRAASLLEAVAQCSIRSRGVLTVPIPGDPATLPTGGDQECRQWWE